LGYVYTLDGTFELGGLEQSILMRGNTVIKVKTHLLVGLILELIAFFSSRFKPSRIIGQELSGIIVELDKDIKGFNHSGRVGRFSLAIGCGNCRFCLIGHLNMYDHMQTVGFDFDGAFADYMLIPSLTFKNRNLNKLSETTSNEEAALAELIACCINA